MIKEIFTKLKEAPNRYLQEGTRKNFRRIVVTKGN